MRPSSDRPFATSPSRRRLASTSFLISRLVLEALTADGMSTKTMAGEPLARLASISQPLHTCQSLLVIEYLWAETKVLIWLSRFVSILPCCTASCACKYLFQAQPGGPLV